MDETRERYVPVARERWALSVTEVAQRLGISRAHAYRMVSTGELPSVRLGGRMVVPVRRLRALLNEPLQDPDGLAAQREVTLVGTSGGTACPAPGVLYRLGVGESPSATVVALHLHPVKSCRRVEVERAVVGRYGLQGDREWQVQDPDGRVLTQRTFPQLARVLATPVGDGLRLAYEELADLVVQRPAAVDTESTTPLGPVPVADAGDDAAAWFEQVVAGPCRLTAIAEGYHRRIVIDGDLFGQEVSLADAAPVHLVNAASHRFLLERAAEPFGIERFRPNVVVDGVEAWEEDTWRHVSLGAADLEVVLPWPRCAVPQVDQDTGQRRREPAVVLKQHRWCALAPSLPEALRPLVEANALFGIAGSIGPEGAVVSVGDDVVVGATGPAVLVPPASPR